MSSSRSSSAVPGGPLRRHRQVNTAAVHISAWLLLIQSLALMALLGLIWWRLAPLFRTNSFIPSTDNLDALLLVVVLAPLTILALPVAAGLFMQRRWAWLLAMLQQAMLLALSLYFFFGLRESIVTRSGAIYAIMLSCIVLVLYLNSTDVRIAAGTADAGQEGADQPRENAPGQGEYSG